jgi:hypothetical protein
VLENEIQFVEKNRDNLLSEYSYKYLLIKEQKVINSFDSYEKAAEEGVRLFGIDESFLVYYLTENEPVNFIMEAVL